MSRPLAAALRPVPGSARLVGVRWLLSVLAAGPGFAVAHGRLLESVGRRPFVSEAGVPLPLPQLRAVLGELGPAWGAGVAGAVLGWLGGLVLTAAALDVLGPRRDGGGVWAAVRGTGSDYVWAFVRVALAALVVLLLGGGAIGAAFAAVADHGARAGWTGLTLLLWLPGARAASLLGWAGLVGVGAFWCRVMLVTGAGFRIRRAGRVVPRLLWRRPFQALVFHWVLVTASAGLGAGVLFAWRQSAAATPVWAAAWLLLLLVQSCVWHWRLRAALLTWSDGSLDDLRGAVDRPLRWRRRVAPVVAPDPTQSIDEDAPAAAGTP